jgi:hypothetical protein
MLHTAAATPPLWASIVIAVVPLVISGAALFVGWKQQQATLGQQATQHAATLEQQRAGLAATLEQQKAELTATLNQQRDQLKANLEHDREQQARTLEHERRKDDLSEARRVLDDAARAVNEADRCHRDIHDDLGNEDKKEALKQAGRKLDETTQRLAIRFGLGYEVTADMISCVELSLVVFGATTHWSLGEHDYGRKEARRAMAEFEDAMAQFIDAATRHAGVELSAHDQRPKRDSRGNCRRIVATAAPRSAESRAAARLSLIGAPGFEPGTSPTRIMREIRSRRRKCLQVEGRDPGRHTLQGHG